MFLIITIGFSAFINTKNKRQQPRQKKVFKRHTPQIKFTCPSLQFPRRAFYPIAAKHI